MRGAWLGVGLRLSTGLRVGNSSHCSFVSTNLRSVPVTHALMTEAAYSINFEVIRNDRCLCSKGVFIVIAVGWRVSPGLTDAKQGLSCSAASLAPKYCPQL